MGSPLGFRGILGRGRIEFALEVPVAESVDGEVAGQHRGEEVGGVRMDRVGRGQKPRRSFICNRYRCSGRVADWLGSLGYSSFLKDSRRIGGHRTHR